MRKTPAQIAVERICGVNHPAIFRRVRSFPDRIVEGRRLLIAIANKDFGYDLQAWHDHLKVTRQGGYSWNRRIALPKVMKTAINSVEWQATVRDLKGCPTCALPTEPPRVSSVVGS